MSPSGVPGDAVEVAGAGLVASVVPTSGGKVVSLRDDTGREWLAPCRELAEGSDPELFVDAEMGGWDECVPTIDPCSLPGGVSLPDHGEAWRAAWQERSDGGLGFESVHLPYAFSRLIAPTDRGLRFNYRLEAAGADPVPVLWAAHPQFLSFPGTRVELVGVNNVVDVYETPGRELPWTDDVGTVDSLAHGASRKVYVAPDRSVDTAVLVHADGSRLTLRWSRAAAPYLGLWFDNAGYSEHSVVAIEPATGFYDSAERALANDRISRIRAGEPMLWHVELEVSR